MGELCISDSYLLNDEFGHIQIKVGPPRFPPIARDLLMGGHQEIAARPSEYLVQLDFWHLTELVDLRPPPGSPFIHSKSEPFEEDDVNDAVLQHWLDRFGLERHQLHASGHLSEREVGDMIRAIDAKVVMPVHTQHADRFTRLARRVVQPIRFEAMALG